MTRDHWFEDLADHLGGAYLRYSFTRGTEQEVGFLVEVLGLEPGMRVLDVGCGPGRHAHALGRRGIEVHGVDISARFVELARQDAPAGVTFARADARALDVDAGFDAAISLCQGAFGLQGGPAGDPDGDHRADREPTGDAPVLAGIARALRAGGRVALSAFSSYFQVRHLPEGTAFDADAGVAHERTTIKDESGADATTDLWTTCFTPRELRLLARSVGLEPEHVWSVEPGRYRRQAPDLDHPEHLLVARRPPG
ncbi:methyltransferase domain-containing protein [Iamia majanohamensis]|uniref:Methyltransferase domain-containing protein n=1 Tax=Iamia majanohamensis TaxID=467976 RepID=A0AAE9YAV7_9ACTN|nr:methyltransferase domain-containing protein [Iamia majanohamensis]WCO69061.1 methyltransferase domain-containing protein [Iamia majanohamensis]